MKPGTASLPFRLMIRAPAGASFAMSVFDPTAAIRFPSIATASAQGRCASPVQIFPLVRITAANTVGSMRWILPKQLHQVVGDGTSAMEQASVCRHHPPKFGQDQIAILAIGQRYPSVQKNGPDHFIGHEIPDARR